MILLGPHREVANPRASRPRRPYAPRGIGTRGRGRGRGRGGARGRQSRPIEESETSSSPNDPEVPPSTPNRTPATLIARSEAERAYASPVADSPRSERPRALRPLAPATGRVTKPPTLTGLEHTSSHNFPDHSFVWGHQMGKSTMDEQSSASPFSAPPISTSTYSALGAIPAQPTIPTTRDQFYTEPYAQDPYYAFGYEMGSRAMGAQSSAYTSLLQPSHHIQNAMEDPARDPYVPRQGLKYCLGVNQFGQSPCQPTTPDTFTAASILTDMNSLRPSTTCTSASQVIDQRQAGRLAQGYSPYQTHAWGQQEGQFAVPQTPTGPDAPHFQISPMDRNQSIPEEALFVEQDSDKEYTDPNVTDDEAMTDCQDLTAGQRVLRSVEVAQHGEGAQASKDAECKEQAEIYGRRRASSACLKGSFRRAMLDEITEYDSESADYEDANDEDYIPDVGSNL